MNAIRRFFGFPAPLPHPGVLVPDELAARLMGQFDSIAGEIKRIEAQMRADMPELFPSFDQRAGDRVAA